MAGRAGKGRILRKDDSCVRLWSSMHEIFIYAQAPCAHRQSPSCQADSYKKDKDRRKGKGRLFCLGEAEFIQFLVALL